MPHHNLMTRLPSLVIPSIPYHFAQRGNRRGQTFFEEADCALCGDLVAQSAGRAGAQVGNIGLMPNHLHIIVAPSDEDRLCRTEAEGR